MPFSEQLRKEANPIFEEIFAHPFVQGIGYGNVPKEALIHYVKQDYEYLNAFAKVYGIAIAKSRSRQDMALFNEQIYFSLHSETEPHQNFCDVAGVRFEDVQGYPLTPSVDHYVNHMLSTAYQGTLGEILAALLPCPWTYWEIADKITRDVQPAADHPFYRWIMFYNSDDSAQETRKLCGRLDQWAEYASEEEQQRMKNAFLKSCQLEYGFWEMAYKQEAWQTEGEVKQ